MVVSCPNGCGEKLPKKDVSKCTSRYIIIAWDSVTAINIHNLMFLQVGKHRRTVCTHQVRDCDFKDIGCQYKVSHDMLIHIISLASCTVISHLHRET